MLIDACRKLLFIQQIFEHLLVSGIVLGPTVVNETYKVPVTINTFIMSDHINTVKEIKAF